MLHCSQVERGAGGTLQCRVYVESTDLSLPCKAGQLLLSCFSVLYRQESVCTSVAVLDFSWFLVPLRSANCLFLWVPQVHYNPWAYVKAAIGLPCLMLPALFESDPTSQVSACFIRDELQVAVHQRSHQRWLQVASLIQQHYCFATDIALRYVFVNPDRSWWNESVLADNGNTAQSACWSLG